MHDPRTHCQHTKYTEEAQYRFAGFHSSSTTFRNIG
jgi:hypothetical protein